MKKYIEDTLKYYDNNSELYYETWNTTFVSEHNFEIPDIFLSYLKPGAYILDCGCGTGRDSVYFKKKGYKVKAIDGSAAMCKIASEALNEVVEQINFLNIEYTDEFDGIFACASLLHLNNEDLIDCMKRLIVALKSDGIMYTAFKVGEEERVKETRFFNDMTLEKFENICKDIPNIEIIKVWENEQYNNHKSFINFIMKKKN